jgi:hypothetical protein
MLRFVCTRKPTDIGTENTQIAQDLIAELVHCRSKKVSQLDGFSSSLVSTKFSALLRLRVCMSKRRGSRYFGILPIQEISAQ